ncbi:hypothetical protein QWA68_016106 [Fusarium oxysporum]|nr:hypothetical protein QWA68_016106 [Fusarium oxysporum]
MTRSEYTRIDKKRTLRRRIVDETYGHTKEVKAWERIKKLAKAPDKSPNLYVQVPSSESSVTSHTLDSLSHAEGKAEPRTTNDRKEDNNISISIEFTHNHPCREDGEDEDLRCLWIPSSDDEEDGEAAHADAVSVTTWPRRT